MFVIPQKCFYLISVKLLKVLFLLYCFFFFDKFFLKEEKKENTVLDSEDKGKCCYSALGQRGETPPFDSVVKQNCCSVWQNLYLE